MRVSTYFSILLAAVRVSAGTVTYQWDVSWVNAAPDGFARPVIGVNGAWPCPTIEATVGDTVVVQVTNSLGNQTTGVHFHGINQINTEFMDGPSGSTQCPVPPGSSITYSFTVDAPGTYWYHSHNMGQYPDGFRGPLIVRDPNDPYKGKYDEEVVLTVSDWYHAQSFDLVRNMLVTTNTQFRPPIPNGILVNEGGTGKINFVKGKVYRVRIISFAAFASAMVHFDSHTMQVIMNDGSYIQQREAYQLRVSPAQRYDVLISALDRDRRNYPYLVSLDINRDFANQATVQWPFNFTGFLTMDPAGNFSRRDVVDRWRPLDDSRSTPLNNEGPIGPVTRTVQLDFAFCFDQNGIPRACFNGKPMIPQKVPTLYTVATTGENNTNPLVYGPINPYVFKKGDIVELGVNNLDGATHPFHLHGHQFQVIDRPPSGSGKWSGRSVSSGSGPRPRRDTVHINANSYAVLRFEVSHPGVFLFHCHIEWHVEMGMTATFIEAPEELRGKTFPQDHLDNCRKMGIPYEGNAAGNTQNPLDQSGMQTVPDPVYSGAMYTPPSTPRRRPRAVRDRL